MILAGFDMMQQAGNLRSMMPALFLDRDGVINQDKGYAHRPAHIQWVEGVFEALALVRQRGYRLFVVTNQSGVGRGFYGEEDVEALHRWMGAELAAAGAGIDDWRFCPYHPDATLPAYRRQHPWRKPDPGMILDLLDHWPTDLSASLLIGDRDSDLAAAAAAGLPGYLFSGGNLREFVETLPPFRTPPPTTATVRDGPPP